MAFSSRTDDETREYFDSPEELDSKVTKLAEAIKNSKHFIAFTGAGGIQCMWHWFVCVDWLNIGKDTVLETGAGVWTRQAADGKGETYKKGKSTSMFKAMPSKTHMALVALFEAGYLKHLTSQNVDGLHRISGFNIDGLDELHGNCKLEVCSECRRQYLRDFEVYGSIHSHETGRLCSVQSCKGALKDTIIHFGETLPEKDINSAFANANTADVCLAIGSSLTVTPAADVPKRVGKKTSNTLCIVNLQKTPLDQYAKIRIYAKCDSVMELLMQKLEVPIPVWYLERCVQIEVASDAKINKKTISVTALDRDDITPASIFDIITIHYGTKKETKSFALRKLCSHFDKTKIKIKNWKLLCLDNVTIELSFMKHYNEPNLVLRLTDLVPKNENSTNDKSKENTTNTNTNTDNTKENVNDKSKEIPKENAEEKKEEKKEEKTDQAEKVKIEGSWEVLLGLKYNPLKGEWEPPLTKKFTLHKTEKVVDSKATKKSFESLFSFLGKKQKE
ncbi:transcriptional regulator, Sir2 family protein [Reticulomyxa filosa]|uniref:Regulatory protein SIR2 homolog 7 n=1 Tax=Reticulomyxa filosa TaxID=46433 RepID=X6M8F1_RETFI|nr:transcriptional regulator, Sir2 family protein [Reticulomyxa filosa]|eukprot:ETO09752.1 transcriptional regulator, Sir2 family protein [Reticulomyxa filosa]